FLIGMIDQKRPIYEFDEFRLDAEKRQLFRAGELVPIYSRAFDLLLMLVQNAGRDITKDEILETVWPGQILEESNLTVNISSVRKALGERATNPRYLVTLPGRGYRFVANVRESQGGNSGFLISSRSISKITVEKETRETEEEGDEDALGLPA